MDFMGYILTEKFESELKKQRDLLSSFIMRNALTKNEEQKFKNFYPLWSTETEYKQGWIIRHNGELYRIGQDHISQSNWIPGTSGTEALYSKIEFTEDNYEIWKEWDGVSGIYAKDQIVKDPTNDQLYISKIDNNVWGPPSTQPDYWQLYVES